MRMPPWCSLAAILFALNVPAVPAQQATFRSGVDLVHVTATVTDSDGRFVPDLTADDFVVYDDGAPQTIVDFERERVPASLGLLLDVSGSMTQAKMSAAHAAIDRFASDLLAGDDELFLAEFAVSTRLLQTWTRDRTMFLSALALANRAPREPGTSVFDAVQQAIVAAATGRHPKRALLLISDGMDSTSRTSLRDLQEQIRSSEVLVYALAVSDRSFPAGGHVDARALRRLTDDTGGRTEVVRRVDDLHEATARLAAELNQQYLISYAAPPRRSGQWYDIDVAVEERGARVRHRRGYVAP